MVEAATGRWRAALGRRLRQAPETNPPRPTLPPGATNGSKMRLVLVVSTLPLFPSLLAVPQTMKNRQHVSEPPAWQHARLLAIAPSDAAPLPVPLCSAAAPRSKTQLVSIQCADSAPAERHMLSPSTMAKQVEVFSATSLALMRGRLRPPSRTLSQPL